MLLEGKKEETLSSRHEKGDRDVVFVIGRLGPQISQEGGEEALLALSIVPGWKGDETASRCSVKVTWKELKRQLDVGSQSR